MNLTSEKKQHIASEIEKSLKKSGYHNVMRAKYLELLTKEIYLSNNSLLSLLKSCPEWEESCSWMQIYQTVSNYLLKNGMLMTKNIFEIELTKKLKDKIEDAGYSAIKLSNLSNRNKKGINIFEIDNKLEFSSAPDSDIANILLPDSSDDIDENNMTNPYVFIFNSSESDAFLSDEIINSDK